MPHHLYEGFLEAGKYTFGRTADTGTVTDTRRISFRGAAIEFAKYQELKPTASLQLWTNRGKLEDTKEAPDLHEKGQGLPLPATRGSFNCK